jgi:hypothetical protein
VCVEFLVPAIIHDGVMLSTKKQEVAVASIFFGALGCIPPRAVLPPSVDVAYFGVADFYTRIPINLDVRLVTIRECAIPTAAVQLVDR